MRVIVLLLAATLAGCFGASEADGALSLVIAGNVEGIAITLEGAWAQQAGGTWHAFVPPSTMVLDGHDATATGTVPQGTYERVRVKFTSITMDGDALFLAEDGVDIPIALQVVEEAEVRLEFDWTEAVYPSVHGPTFLPVLSGLRITEDGQATVDLERRDIEVGGSKAPVARIRAFDDTGLQVFESDFVADSPSQRVLGTSGNLTFTASDSEAVEAGATLMSYTWDFGDGATADGSTVTHSYPLQGGNFTVRLTVTDSADGTDSQVLKMGLLPAQVETTFPFSGRVTGANGNPAQSGGGVHTFDVDPEMTPGGQPASGITAVRGILMPQGALLPGSDLDLRLTDGANAQIASEATGSSTETFEVEFTDRQPKGGAWTVSARPDPAVDAPYTIDITVRWQLAGDAAFIAWAATHDDGHEHKH